MSPGRLDPRSSFRDGNSILQIRAHDVAAARHRLAGCQLVALPWRKDHRGDGARFDSGHRPPRVVGRLAIGVWDSLANPPASGAGDRWFKSNYADSIAVELVLVRAGAC
jgi:hypothetical protein